MSVFHIDSDCEVVRGVGWCCTCRTAAEKADEARERAEAEAERDQEVHTRMSKQANDEGPTAAKDIEEVPQPAKRDDGGPAYPQPPCPDCGVVHAPEHVPGASLRDYFAAKAIGSLIECKYTPSQPLDFESIARLAFCQADAMLAERAK